MNMERRQLIERAVDRVGEPAFRREQAALLAERAAPTTLADFYRFMSDVDLRAARRILARG